MIPVRSPKHGNFMKTMLYRTCLLSAVFFYLAMGVDLSTASSASAVKGFARFASFNVSFHRRQAGQLVQDLRTGDSSQAKKIAEIIQRIRPDVLLLNEFDYHAQKEAVKLFITNYLTVSHNTQKPISYPYCFLAPVNTGEPSGHDLDRDGTSSGLADAFGYGHFPGQYGMLVLSRYPIQASLTRTFQRFLWKDMPKARLPKDPQTGKPFYDDEVLKILRLSSKSHWDVPIQISSQTVHFLVSHPTPPVFDGPEDRNGTRNHDEVRFWADYIDPQKSDYIYDDRGTPGGLPANAHFVIAGDLNADPADGSDNGEVIQQILTHPLIRMTPAPSSAGAVAAAQHQGRTNDQQKGNSAYDTADFNDKRIGNLRVDYVLISQTLHHLQNGVFWPRSTENTYPLINATDHRLVWQDVHIPP